MKYLLDTCVVSETRKRPSVVTDSMIAATALSHGMAMVTRNVGDFQFGGLSVVNPFEEQEAA